jgi:hypothetical protein
VFYCRRWAVSCLQKRDIIGKVNQLYCFSKVLMIDMKNQNVFKVVRHKLVKKLCCN